MRIHCEKCGRPVEDVRLSLDIASDVLTITALCHGEEEIMQLDKRGMTSAQLRLLETSEGVAFRLAPRLVAR